MTLQVQESEYCKLEVLYTADSSVVKTKRAEAIKAIQKDKTVKLKGYRPGHASSEAIQLYLKPQIKNWMSRELCQEGFNDLVYEKNVKAVLEPQVLSAELNQDDFWCRMMIHTKPQFELKQYTGWDIPKPVVESVDQATALSMENLRRQQGDFQVFEDTDVVGLGDKLTINLKLYLDDKLIEVREGILHHVGEMPEIEPHLIGMKLDETRSFEELCADNFPLQVLQGKKAKFEVTVLMGLKITPASLDELPAKFGMKTFEEFMAVVKSEANAKIEQKYQTLLNQQIVSRLLEAHDFKVPEFLIDLEFNRLLHVNKTQANQLSEEQTKIWKEVCEKNAKLACILDSIRDKEPDCFYSDQDLLKGLQNKIISSGQDPKAFFAEAQKDGSLFQLLGQLKDQIVIDYIAKKCNIVE
jgi:trigger factor